MYDAKVLPEKFGSPLGGAVVRVVVGLSFIKTRRVQEAAHDSHIARDMAECGIYRVNRHLERGPFLLVGAQRYAADLAPTSYGFQTRSRPLPHCGSTYAPTSKSVSSFCILPNDIIATRIQCCTTIWLARSLTLVIQQRSQIHPLPDGLLYHIQRESAAFPQIDGKRYQSNVGHGVVRVGVMNVMLTS